MAISKRSIAPSAPIVSTKTVHFARVISQPSLSKDVGAISYGTTATINVTMSQYL